MPKKRQVSSQQQRRVARARQQDNVNDDDTTSSSLVSYTLLRSTLPPSSYIPAVMLQMLCVAYCLLAVNGRPTSVFSFNALLKPLIQDTNKSLLRTLAGMCIVQLYSAIQLKLWSDRVDNENRITEDIEDEDTAKDETNAQTTPSPSVNRFQAVLSKIDLSRLDLPSIPETLIAVGCMSLLIFTLIILMGAPIARLLPETALLSIWLALLAFTVPLHVLRSPFSLSTRKLKVRNQWVRVFATFGPTSDIEIAVLLPAYGAIIGSLIGVIPEGLDWEMPWQKWPIPCLLGSFTGWSIGQLASLALCSLLWLARPGSKKRLRSMNSSTSDVKDD